MSHLVLKLRDDLAMQVLNYGNAYKLFKARYFHKEIYFILTAALLVGVGRGDRDYS
jgi:hypothetical protein